MNRFNFEQVRQDNWGNWFVHCPVCEFTYKDDGVVKHLLQRARAGEGRHAAWVRKNFGKRSPTPSQLVPAMRP